MARLEHRRPCCWRGGQSLRYGCTGDRATPPTDARKTSRQRRPPRDTTAETSSLSSVIDAAWERREALSERTTGEVRDAVTAALDLLDYPDRAARRIGREVLNALGDAKPLVLARLSAKARLPLSGLAGLARL